MMAARARTLAPAAALLELPRLAHAHADAAGSAWTFDAAVTIPLGLALVLFALGHARARLRSGSHRALRRQALLYLSGWSVLVFALVSPLHQAGERSFAAHMLEHELLMLVAAPLLVAAHPGGILLWALPRATRAASAALLRGSGLTGAWRRLAEPLPATLLQAAALWLWHAPPLFDRALASPGWHVAQHLSFFAAALLFWIAMLDRRRRREPGVAIGCLFATALVSGALGALMAFASSPWYAGYRALGLGAFGLGPVEDQQAAGLLMWIPGGAVHAAVALMLLARVLRTRPAQA